MQYGLPIDCDKSQSGSLENGPDFTWVLHMHYLHDLSCGCSPLSPALLRGQHRGLRLLEVPTRMPKIIRANVAFRPMIAPYHEHSSLPQAFGKPLSLLERFDHDKWLHWVDGSLVSLSLTTIEGSSLRLIGKSLDASGIATQYGCFDRDNTSIYSSWQVNGTSYLGRR